MRKVENAADHTCITRLLGRTKVMCKDNHHVNERVLVSRLTRYRYTSKAETLLQVKHVLNAV